MVDSGKSTAGYLVATIGWPSDFNGQYDSQCHWLSSALSAALNSRSSYSSYSSYSRSGCFLSACYRSDHTRQPFLTAIRNHYSRLPFSLSPAEQTENKTKNADIAQWTSLHLAQNSFFSFLETLFGTSFKFHFFILIIISRWSHHVSNPGELMSINHCKVGKVKVPDEES